MQFKDITEFDHRISGRLRLRQDKRAWYWYLAAITAHSGDSWFWLAGLFLVWLLGSPEWHNRATLLAIGIVFQAAVVLAIKFTVRRRRPEGEWGAIYRKSDPHSFPSGHATRAGLLAAMALGLGPAWFAVTMLIWAPLLSLSRVLTGVHYLSDILAGIAFGILLGVVTLQFQPLFTGFLPFLFW